MPFGPHTRSPIMHLFGLNFLITLAYSSVFAADTAPLLRTPDIHANLVVFVHAPTFGPRPAQAVEAHGLR